MATPPFIPLFLFGFIFASAISLATATAKPAPLVFPVEKDNSTNRYYATLQLGTPPAAMNAVLDLTGQFTWLDCSAYKSSSFRHIPCNSSRCDVTGADGCVDCSYGPGGTTCTNGTCGVILVKFFSDMMTSIGLGEDVLVLHSRKRNKYTSKSKFQQFPFTCVESYWAENLPESAKGMVALARNPSSLATKLPKQLNLPHKFALCLPSSSRSGHGNLYVGGGPYAKPPIKQDLAKSLLRTQLLISPGTIAPVSSEGDGYTINVTAVKVDSSPLTFNSSVLKIDKDGFGGGGGGATINPLNPFTSPHSEIFTPLVKEFTKKAKSRKIEQVMTVAPFGACFDAKTVKSGVAGPDVPAIVLVLQGGAQWRIEGANSMVRVSKDVMCLGFSDGGTYGMGAMAIGGHQMEDNLVEFDVGSSTFGFSNSLLLRNSSCSHS